MKKRILHITLIVAAYVLLTAKSCEPEPGKPAVQQDNVNFRVGKMVEEFDSEYLTAERQSALTEKAKQKLNDFSDYLNLTADQKMEITFRKQAQATASSLFYSRNPDIYIPLPTNHGISNTNTLQSLFASIDAGAYSSIAFHITNLGIRDPLTLENDTLYQGQLGCHINVQGITTADTVKITSGPLLVDVMVVRTSKKFGNKKTRQVWQVFLGDILREK